MPIIRNDEPLKFGKHRGRMLIQIAIVDPDYLIWISNQPNFMTEEMKRFTAVLIGKLRVNFTKKEIEYIKAEYSDLMRAGGLNNSSNFYIKWLIQQQIKKPYELGRDFGKRR